MRAWSLLSALVLVSATALAADPDAADEPIAPSAPRAARRTAAGAAAHRIAAESGCVRERARVVVELHLTPSGRIGSARLVARGEGAPLRTLERCLRRALRGRTIPEARGEGSLELVQDLQLDPPVPRAGLFARLESGPTGSLSADGGSLGALMGDPLAGQGGLGLRGEPVAGLEGLGLGTLSRERIQTTVRAHLAEVRACYSAAVVAQPDLRGRLVIRFVIDRNGAVASAEITTDTLGAPRVSQCVLGAARQWTFPAPPGGGVVTVSYPFAFAPEPPTP